MMIKITSPLIIAYDDTVWRQWTSLPDSGDYRNLLALVRDAKIRKSLRARALLVALLPHDGYAWSPIKTPSDLSSFSPHDLDLRQFDDVDLIRLAVEVVCAVLKRPPGYCGHGIYHKWLRQCVTQLPFEEAEAAFSKHPLNDPKPYCNMDFASGYGPFGDILGDPDLPVEWKRRADSVMRDLVTAEIEGRAKPRVEWEAAPRCYADAVTTRFYGGLGSCDMNFLADQIEFVYSHAAMSSEIRHSFDRIVAAFPAGTSWTRLRYRIAQVEFLEMDELPFLYDAADVAAAESLLVEFGPSDEQLRLRIGVALADVYERRAADRAEVAKQEAEREALLEEMS